MSSLIEYALIGMAAGVVLTVGAIAADLLDRVLRRRSAYNRLHVLLSPEREKTALHLLRSAGEVGAFSPVAHLARLYTQSGSKMSPAALGAIGVAAAVATFWIVGNALVGGLGAGVAAVLIGALAPYALLTFFAGRRRAAFVAQLPEAIDVVVRSLRAGHPLSTAIGMVGRDLPEPAGAEFAAVSKEMSFGLDLETATRNLARRMASPEIDVLAAAISIQQKTGGNLAEVLTRIATLLRDRARLRGKAKALSSEGRMTGLFLSALPFLMFFVLNALNPKYYGDVRDNPIVAPVLIFTVFWMAIGIVVINRMVNIKA